MEYLREGGWYAYLVVGLGLLTNVFGVAGGFAAASFPRRGLRLVIGVALIAVACLTVALGATGYLSGLSQVDAALLAASPEFQDQLRAEGQRIAQIPLVLAIGASILPLLVGMGALGAGLNTSGDQAN